MDKEKVRRLKSQNTTDTRLRFNKRFGTALRGLLGGKAKALQSKEGGAGPDRPPVPDDAA